MAKLGSEKRRVIVRVKTGERAHAITAACTMRGWQCIAGVEPDESEDISDFERLMYPVTRARSAKVGRNEPCPCGSGKKYKRCCADRDEGVGQAGSPAGRFRYEPGSYGGPVAGYMPSILCYERSGPDVWRGDFFLVEPGAGMEGAPSGVSHVPPQQLGPALSRGARAICPSISIS